MDKLNRLMIGLVMVFLVSCQQSTKLTEELSVTATNLWVSGYYVGYLDYPVSEIDFSGITHLMIGAILPKSNATLEVSLYTANGSALAREAVQAAHANGKKAIAFIGGENTGPEWLAASRGSNRAKFVSNLKKLMTDYGFDGLDLDWEPVLPTDKPYVLALVKNLRKALPTAILTFPAGGILNANFPEDLSFYGQLAPYLDQLNLMTYGMAASWEGWQSWHSSPLYQYPGPSSPTPTSVDYTLKAYRAVGIPASKLGIGIGFYGNCWTAPVTGPRQDLNGATMVAGDNDMSYNNIVRFYDTASARRWDNVAKASYLTFSQPRGPKGCTFISYENASSIRIKSNYVKAQGLGGVILWNINEGYIPTRSASNRNPLLVATRKYFLE
jgi:chitinase